MRGSKNEIRLQAGESLCRGPKEPVVTMIGRGRKAYLWIGNDADDNKYCFATLSGQRLRELANEILSKLPKARS